MGQLYTHAITPCGPCAAPAARAHSVECWVLGTTHRLWASPNRNNRSRQYVLATDAHGRHLSEWDLLEKLFDIGIRILINTEAQILEMNNFSLMKKWLSVNQKALTAVYFNNNNKLSVYY